jgi:hypothetical protein
VKGTAKLWKIHLISIINGEKAIGNVLEGRPHSKGICRPELEITPYPLIGRII